MNRELNSELVQIAVEMVNKSSISFFDRYSNNKRVLFYDLSSNAIISLLSNFSIYLNLEFTVYFLKIVLSSELLTKRIETLISKLVKEPYLTAIEQLRIACSLKPNTNLEREYCEERFKDSLLNFDRAFSLASSKEKPIIDLFRGICALNISGGKEEAFCHIKDFQTCCFENMKLFKAEILELSKNKKLIEDRISSIHINNQIQSVNDHSLIGGGSFLQMGMSEEKVQKALHAQKRIIIETRINTLKSLYREYNASINYLNVIILNQKKQPNNRINRTYAHGLVVLGEDVGFLKIKNVTG